MKEATNKKKGARVSNRMEDPATSIIRFATESLGTRSAGTATFVVVIAKLGREIVLLEKAPI
jgi:hypothetical protein